VIGLSVALHFHLLIFYYLGLVTFIFYFKLLDIILVSVRNVVPTLTSNKRQGISLNGRCQAIRDRVLSWFRPGGRTSSSGVLGALYCSAPGCLQWGCYKQGGRGSVASKSLVKWLKILWENWKASVWCVSCCLLLSLVVLLRPLRRGTSPSFYRPRRGQITYMSHY
jgi:hypothetical protein